MTLEDQIANLGYPVGMGIAPHPDDVAAMRNAIIEDKQFTARAIRAATIEQCARVLETRGRHDLAAVILALKDKHAEWEKMLELGADECHCPVDVMRNALHLMMPTIRDAITEECAKVAEKLSTPVGGQIIAAAIRALSRKP